MHEISTYDEKELFLRISEGDEKAFGELYRIYVGRLVPFVSRMVRSDAIADEIIQEVFLSLWISRDKLPGVQEPKAWIFRIASNICYSHLRKAITERKALSHIGGAGEGEVHHHTEAGELTRLIRQAIGQLPKQRKKIYRLSREAGMTIPEIAQKLGISHSTVKNTLVTSLQSIREFLRERGYDLPLLIICLRFF